MESNGYSAGDDSIKVFVRVRPPDPKLEGQLVEAHCLNVTSSTTVCVQSRPDPKIFTFDHVAGMETTQEDVFLTIGRPIIESCMCGYNGTIFAYGQTGSGKTFTMIGPTQEDSDTFTHELRGIIPRGFEYLFSLINREIEKFGDLVEFLCKCSFLEIYNEQVFDLLDPASCGLHLRENMAHGVYVDSLTEQSIFSARDAYQVLRTGWVNRRVASTSMNRESSRSHAVFTLTIESKKRESKDSIAKIKSSLLNLVDLAGSERQRDTHTVSLRLKEAGSINRSLSALGNVIMALVDITHGKSRHVHYRDSKLTFLLRDSLGGNARTNLVANVHPSAKCFGETLSTLNFAKRAKMIKNKAVVNEDTSGNVQQLQAEIKRLRIMVDKLRNCMVTTPPFPATPEEGAVAMLAHSSSSSSSSSSLLSDDQKTIRELKSMLSLSMSSREKVEASKMALLERVENLQKLCEKKNKFLQSTKMILKFRETHIKNMERDKSGTTSSSTPTPTHTTDSTGETITLLKQEIEQLKYMINHHPDITRFALENLDLRAELKRVRASSSSSSSLPRELARSHQYTLQLERQLRHYLARRPGGSDSISPVKVGGAGAGPRLHTPAGSAETVARLQGKCQRLQTELDTVRQQLATEREEFRVKETKLETSLTLAKKANQELERSIDALKLKSSVEKATLNDMHMATIRTMLTPKRSVVATSRSVTNTPFRRADSDPVKHPLTFTQIKSAPSSPHPPHPPTIPESTDQTERVSIPVPRKVLGGQSRTMSSVGVNTNISGDFPGPNEAFSELNIEGALTDELKLLQDGSRRLQTQLEVSESRVSYLERDKADLEGQLQELDHSSRTEHAALLSLSKSLLEKVAEITTQTADLTSTNTVLESEVADLRICLKSADKELNEIKSEKKQEKNVHEEKIMDLMQKIGELERLLASKATDLDRQTEVLQNLQDEVETTREELTFKEHRVHELEEALRREKEQVVGMEGEIQTVLGKLAREVERNTQLSSELQQGQNGKQELVNTLNENARLASNVAQLESELKSQLQRRQQQATETESTIASLHSRQMADREAIGSLMGQLQEVRSCFAGEQARMASLRKELSDTEKELGEASARVDRQMSEIEALQVQMKTQSREHKREICKKDSEQEVVSEELEHVSEQYQQLSSAFEAQTAELCRTETERRGVGERLAEREEELSRAREKRERKASLSKAQSEDLRVLLAEAEEEIDRLRSELDRAVSMIGDYERSREEKDLKIHQLEEELQSSEDARWQLSLLETDHTSQQYQLNELQLKEEDLTLALRESEAQLEQLQIDYFSVVHSRDQTAEERDQLRGLVDEQRGTIESLADQLCRYKAIEGRLFEEKRSLHSQLEALSEEKSKLAKECANLAKENALISGHQNLRQKIQYHASTKIENSKLKEEVMLLEKRLRIKSEELNFLQKKVNDLMRDPVHSSPSKKQSPTTHLSRAASHHLLLKENFLPK